jgi:hypothetical protein
LQNLDPAGLTERLESETCLVAVSFHK